MHFSWDISLGSVITWAGMAVSIAYAVGRVVEAVDRISAEVDEVRALHYEHAREVNERFNQQASAINLVATAAKKG